MLVNLTSKISAVGAIVNTGVAIWCHFVGAEPLSTMFMAMALLCYVSHLFLAKVSASYQDRVRALDTEDKQD
jgi:hypothetical protein